MRRVSPWGTPRDGEGQASYTGLMDLDTARALSALTTRFYHQVSQSFSATRQTPWPGWLVLEEFLCHNQDAPWDVLDLACGNLRFERFLAAHDELGQAWVVDNCDQLVREGIASLCEAPGVRTPSYHPADLSEALFAALGQPLSVLDEALGLPGAAQADLAVCFGFMHHVPLPEQRVLLLRELVWRTRPGGLIAISFWQFAHNEKLRAKARHVEGGDPGDFLLGWQGQEEALRYCHSFEEDELDDLAASVAHDTQELARYDADGRTGDLNRYVLLRRR